MTKLDKIDKEIKKYFGDRYYVQYHPKAVTGSEMENIRKLISDCIQISNIKEEKLDDGND